MYIYIYAHKYAYISTMNVGKSIGRNQLCEVGDARVWGNNRDLTSSKMDTLKG
jgi:hypothetical protein